MSEKVKELGISLLGILIIVFVVFLFVSDGRELFWNWDAIPPVLTNFKVMFLSILIEAFPFVLIGVLVSSLIQVFISEEMIRRIIPKNVLISAFIAGALGIIFPVCECAIIPVTRRLIQKGMPLHAGITFMLTAPIVNPVVFASTKMAFKAFPEVAYYRIILAFVIAVIIGFIIYFFFKKEEVLLPSNAKQHIHNHTHKDWREKLKSLFTHASEEVFDMGKFLIIGALLAASIQTFISRETLLGIGQNELSSQGVMMGLAYVLSLCSEADAFVAASFSTTFTLSSILAFLVYGPMIDLKNTLMLFSLFKPKFVAILILLITITVWIGTLIVGRLHI
jgi:hypothetical protein